MSKKILAMLLAIMICVTGIWSMGSDVRAEEQGEDLDFSYLLTENTVVGSMQTVTWGVYLAEGNSYITNMGGGVVGAGGDTIAATRCDVAITSILERNVNGSWKRVASWSDSTTSGFSATVSKSVYVGTGYYYRVRSTHTAETDYGSSVTEPIYM